MSNNKRDWIENVILSAKDVIKAGHSCPPIFCLKHKKSVKVISLDQFPSKDVWSAFMRAAIVATKPSEYLFIGESWMKKFDAKKRDERKKAEEVAEGLKQVHEFEDKIEILLLTHGRRSKGERTGIIEILRKDKLVEFGELEWMPMTIEGRLANLWNPFSGESKRN